MSEVARVPIRSTITFKSTQNLCVVVVVVCFCFVFLPLSFAFAFACELLVELDLSEMPSFLSFFVHHHTCCLSPLQLYNCNWTKPKTFYDVCIFLCQCVHTYMVGREVSLQSGLVRPTHSSHTWHGKTNTNRGKKKRKERFTKTYDKNPQPLNHRMSRPVLSLQWSKFVAMLS